MSIKADRPQVRTAQDLERKYASLLNSGTAIKQTETGLVKVNNILSEFIAATIGDLQTLQAQLDGEIDTWYGSGVPTLSNEPASNWQVSEYENHIGDLYYDQNTGDTYQFSEDNGTYSWIEVESSLMSEILSMANAAKDTADNKRRVFVTQPSPPYERGDLWLNNQELYVCQIAKGTTGTYEDGDFIIATKYTDDGTALSAQQAAQRAYNKAMDVYTDGTMMDLNFSKRLVLDDDSVVDEKFSKITFQDGAITFSAGDSKIKIVIDNDSIEFQDNEGNVFASWNATQDIATTTTLNMGNFAFIPRDNGSLGFRKVK